MHARWLLFCGIFFYPSASFAGVPKQPRPIPEKVHHRDLVDTPATISDSTRAEQWALDNVGQVSGLFDADIDAEAAWEISEGAPEILVAVIDTGVDLTHPDLADVLWVNDVELNGEAGVDDDNNGCIDDVHGCNFANGCGEFEPDCNPQPIGDVFDNAGHGTNVAGIIAASAKDAMGISGVAPNVRIVALQIRDASQLWYDNQVFNALSYAAHIGANVVNISGYFDGNDLAKQAAGLSLVTDAGGLIVGTAGNTGLFLDEHKVDYPYLPTQSDNPLVLKVAAIDKYERLISYPGWWGSSFGTNVQVAAPSHHIHTTNPTDSDRGPYTNVFSGTSAAAPFVSGVAALIWSVSPGLSAVEVRDILIDSVDEVSSLDGKVTSGGRVNAANAVRLATITSTLPKIEITAAETTETGVSQKFEALATSSSDETNGDWMFHWNFGDGSSTIVTEEATVEHAFLKQGEYIVSVEVVDSDGLRATARHRIATDLTWLDVSEETLATFLLETEHPYQTSSSFIKIPDAGFFRMHFERFELSESSNSTVSGGDGLLVFDDGVTPLWSMSGSGTDFWTKAIPVMRGGQQLMLFSNIGDSWGYKIDRVQYTSNEEMELSIPSEDSGGCGCRQSNGNGASSLLLIGMLLFVCTRCYSH